MTLIASLLVATAIGAHRSRSRCRLVPVRSRPHVRGGSRRKRLMLVAGIAPLSFVLTTRAVVVALVVAAGLVAGRLRRTSQSARPDVALTFDVLAACIEAGAMPAAAARAAGGAATDDVALALGAVATGLERGDDPDDVWNVAGARVPALEPAARACRRTAVTGAAVADELRRAAGSSRAQRAAEQRRRVRRASVWLVLPLGLCFLPAFVLVGVVPLVAALLPGFMR